MTLFSRLGWNNICSVSVIGRACCRSPRWRKTTCPEALAA